MPQRKNTKSPPEVMTWGGAVPILSVTVIFDLLRILFEQFWFFGPAIATAYCTTKGIALGMACTTAVAAIGFFGSTAITAFGVIMAMAVGLFGWMTIGLALIMTNPRIFKKNASSAIHFGLGLLVSELPIIGTIPALTISVAKMYHAQIKQEKEELKQYEKEYATEIKANQQQEQQQQMIQLMQARSIEQEQEEATIREEESQAKQEQEEVENGEEIPEEVREAA